MSELLAATPLKPGTVTQTYTFADGIAIRELSPILWEEAIVKTSLSDHDRQELAHTAYWLCADQTADRHLEGERDLYDRARHAMWALQLICPSGAKNVYLRFRRTTQGFDNIGSEQPKKLCSTLIGRITRLEDQGLVQHFDTVYAGVNRVFTEKVVRLQNPILLIEHGMQIGNAPLGTLFFVMGLDMLVMAGEKIPFVERLGGLLGPYSYVFPPDSVLRRQPSVTVEDVLSSLYDFRNIMAHGQKIPKHPYRQPYELRDSSGSQINYGEYSYVDLMLESSLFLLVAALRKIFTDGLFDVVRDEKQWRSQLRTYEHRWKSTVKGGTPAKGR